jgi:putative polyketide hydroxylase
MLSVAMGYSYPRGAVLDADPERAVVPAQMELTGEPGTRAPHMWVCGPEGRKSTLDLYERSFVLLSGSGTEWRAAARKTREQLCVRLDAFAIGDGPDADLAPEDEADWAVSHGTTADGAVLVRPDGFVAWRSANAVPNPAATLHKVMTSLLHRV